MFELKESDLPELERLAAVGYKWIARDLNEELYAFLGKPSRFPESVWAGRGAAKISQEHILDSITWDTPPLDIAVAIAQIKAQKKHECLGVESAEEILNEFCAEQDKKPLTWNERINQMTVEEKAAKADGQGLCVAEVFDGLCQTPARGGSECLSMTCKECWERVLTSPCEGGEKE